RHTCSLDAFSAGDSGPLARHCEGRVEFLARPAAPPSALLSGVERRRLGERKTLPHVAIVEALFDAPADPALVALEGAQAAVLAAFGAGHVPESWVDRLAQFARRHPLVLASRTGGGPVLAATYAYRGAEIDLLGQGLISAGWLAPAKARLALLLLLAAGVEGDDLRARFSELAAGPPPRR
ncbi:MAG: asparaginase, partial [Alphaproteobacteria bacterium]